MDYQEYQQAFRNAPVESLSLGHSRKTLTGESRTNSEILA